MRTPGLIELNMGQSSIAGHQGQGAEACAERAAFGRRPALAPARACANRRTRYLRDLRAAELAAWEATGGDVLSAESAHLLRLPPGRRINPN